MPERSEKPDCYKCKHRGVVPGSAHICCKHPDSGLAGADPLLGLASIFASVGRCAPVQGEGKLKVKGNPHGIRKGWFQHPFIFDPTWLVECDGFEAKEGE